MTDPTRRGYRIFVDVLLDTSATRIDGQTVPNAAERAACIFLDVLKDAGINLCGTLHVSRLRRDVNPHTGEISWKPAGIPQARITEEQSHD